jgi:hypothetical protein
VCLRIPNLPLPLTLETARYDCYTGEYAGRSIAWRSPKLEMQLPRPGVNRTCAWDGYRWHHHGDRYGYRNPKNWERADVVLLGDSTTYGHGVEETSTAAHFLRQDLGRSVVNLGWTGDSPVQYLARLRNYALPLHPRVVVVFFYQNDLEDIVAYRSAADIRHFVETGDALESALYERAELSMDLARSGQTLGTSVREHLLTFSALKAMLALKGPPLEEDTVALVPDLSAEVPLVGSEHLALEYLEAAAKVMATSATAAGVKLVFSVIPSIAFERRMQVVRQHVHAIAESLGIPFLDLIGKFAENGHIEFGDYFLLHDGHLAEAGHRRVAREVANFIREQKLLEAR